MFTNHCFSKFTRRSVKKIEKLKVDPPPPPLHNFLSSLLFYIYIYIFQIFNFFHTSSCKLTKKMIYKHVLIVFIS
jgi:hypothetical protein